MYDIPADKSKILPNVFRSTCPARYLLDQISGKWGLLIIDALADKSIRNGELLRMVEGISQKMLTQTLRELEDIKLVERHDKQTIPPHVEYRLSAIGLELREKVCALDRWIEEHMLEIIPEDKVRYV